MEAVAAAMAQLTASARLSVDDKKVRPTPWRRPF